MVEHGRARERTHLALHIGAVAAREAPRFIKENNGSLGETESLSASALRDTRDILTADIVALEDDLMESFRTVPPFPTADRGPGEVAVRFRAPVAHDEDIHISLAEIVSPPPPDPYRDGSDGEMGLDLFECMDSVNEASEGVDRATESHREATVAAKSSQEKHPAAEAAVAVAVNLAVGRKSPEENLEIEREASVKRSDAMRAQASAIRAFVLTTETVQRSGNAALRPLPISNTRRPASRPASKPIERSLQPRRRTNQWICCGKRALWEARRNISPTAARI